MIKKEFTTFVNIIDGLIKQETSRAQKSVITNSFLYGDNYRQFVGLFNIPPSFMSDIRDNSDGIVYFMVGFDRVGDISKIGA